MLSIMIDQNSQWKVVSYSDKVKTKRYWKWTFKERFKKKNRLPAASSQKGSVAPVLPWRLPSSGKRSCLNLPSNEAVSPSLWSSAQLHSQLLNTPSPSPMAFSYLAIHMPAMVKIEKPCQWNLTECSSSPTARTAESSRDTQPRGGSDLPLIQRF